MHKYFILSLLIGLLLSGCNNEFDNFEFQEASRNTSVLGTYELDHLYSIQMPTAIGDYWKYESIPFNANYSFDYTISDVKYAYGLLCYVFEREAPRDTSTDSLAQAWKDFWNTRYMPITSMLEDVFIGQHIARWKFVYKDWNLYATPGVLAFFEYPFWDEADWRSVQWPRDGYVEMEFPVYQGKKWEAYTLTGAERHEYGSLMNPDLRSVDLACIRTCEEHIPVLTMESTGETFYDCYKINEALIRQEPVTKRVLASFSNQGDFWYCARIGLVKVDVYLQNQDPSSNRQTTNKWELVNYRINQEQFINGW